jgi:hypothetical protein
MTADINYLGCYAEQAFATACTKQGYIVSKPFLDSSPYDLVVDNQVALFKVQVKYTSQTPNEIEQRNSVHISLSNNKSQYTLKAVDYFAIYSEYHGGFFIIPNTGNMKSIRLNANGKYSDYFNKFVFK